MILSLSSLFITIQYLSNHESFLFASIHSKQYRFSLRFLQKKKLIVNNNQFNFFVSVIKQIIESIHFNSKQQLIHSLAQLLIINLFCLLFIACVVQLFVTFLLFFVLSTFSFLFFVCFLDFFVRIVCFVWST